MILTMILRRLGMGVVTILAAAIISFLLVHSMDGSPGQIKAGMGSTAEEIAAINHEIGWDLPLPTQFANWFFSFIQGDLGTSFLDGRDLSSEIWTRIQVTASLALFGAIVTALIGVTVGVVAAVRGGIIDRVLNSTSNIGVALPSYWLAILLVLAFAITLPLLPPTGYVSFEEDPASAPLYLVLPVLGLALPAAAGLARMSRAAMLDAFAAEHIRTLRAMGEPRFTLIYVHVLRLASVQIVSMIGMNFILLFGGTVMVEQLFVLPGLGSGAMEAIQSHDVPQIQATVVITTVVVVISSLVTELVIMFLDPKVRTK